MNDDPTIKSVYQSKFHGAKNDFWHSFMPALFFIFLVAVMFLSCASKNTVERAALDLCAPFANEHLFVERR